MISRFGCEEPYKTNRADPRCSLRGKTLLGNFVQSRIIFGIYHIVLALGHAHSVTSTSLILLEFGIMKFKLDFFYLCKLKVYAIVSLG